MTNATETTIKTVESFGHTFAVTREVIFKDLRNGWEGQTRIDMGLDGFGQPRMLMLTTGKPHRRQDKGIGATTTATLYKVDGAFIRWSAITLARVKWWAGIPRRHRRRRLNQSMGAERPREKSNDTRIYPSRSG